MTKNEQENPTVKTFAHTPSEERTPLNPFDTIDRIFIAIEEMTKRLNTIQRDLKNIQKAITDSNKRRQK